VISLIDFGYLESFLGFFLVIVFLTGGVFLIVLRIFVFGGGLLRGRVLEGGLILGGKVMGFNRGAVIGFNRGLIGRLVCRG